MFRRASILGRCFGFVVGWFRWPWLLLLLGHCCGGTWYSYLVQFGVVPMKNSWSECLKLGRPTLERKIHVRSMLESLQCQGRLKAVSTEFCVSIVNKLTQDDTGSKERVLDSLNLNSIAHLGSSPRVRYGHGPGRHPWDHILQDKMMKRSFASCFDV